ncbi:MAG: hypothetical protein ACL93V_12560 [Candidatus Electrothrix sp. YB6]
MNKYQTHHRTQTFSTLIISGILASTCLSPSVTDDLSLNIPPCTASSNYDSINSGISSTYESTRDSLPEQHSSSEEVETVITNFFSKLSANQEPLGSEFEHVLFEDLWDLYQS